MVIYKTTNLINGKYYIGKDSKNDPKYLGSGVLLNLAINKYGKENFKKEILHICNSINELNSLEREIVNEDVCKDPKSYNLAQGGHGGDLLLGASEERKEIRRNKLSLANTGDKNPMFGKPLLNEHKEKISNSLKGNNNPMYGMKQSEEGRKRISESNKRPNHPNNNREGCDNPFHGKTHSDENKKMWSEKRSGGGNPMARKCVAGGQEFPSTRDAGKALGIHQSTVRQRINNPKKTDYYYL
jgi:group I intron endonuclease